MLILSWFVIIMDVLYYIINNKNCKVNDLSYGNKKTRYSVKNFTLYPAHSRVGRGNLVLSHSVPHFLPNSGGIAWQIGKFWRLSHVTRVLEWESNPQSVTFVALRRDSPLTVTPLNLNMSRI